MDRIFRELGEAEEHYCSQVATKATHRQRLFVRRSVTVRWETDSTVAIKVPDCSQRNYLLHRRRQVWDRLVFMPRALLSPSE